LRNILRASETVSELGQGQFEKNQGLIVLTNERIFFFVKGPGQWDRRRLSLAVTNSLSIGTEATGETFKIYSSWNSAEIRSMMPGGPAQP